MTVTLMICSDQFAPPCATCALLLRHYRGSKCGILIFIGFAPLRHLRHHLYRGGAVERVVQLINAPLEEINWELNQLMAEVDF